MKKVSARIALTVLSLLFAVGMVPATAFADPVAIEEGTASIDADIFYGDYIYFGSYPQSAYTPTSAPGTPATDITYTDTDGTQFVYSGSSYYKIEPIAWRVLSNDGTNLFLLADKNLDASIPYNNTRADITWENSTVRTWLNGAFYTQAFSADEQSAIATTTVVNDAASHPDYPTTPGGADTSDKLFFLSVAEVRNSAYGFTVDNNTTDTRVAVNTAYAASKPNAASAGVRDDWWLRSPGISRWSAAIVRFEGSVITTGSDVEDKFNAVRPAFNLNLSSVIFTSHSSAGDMDKSNATVGGGFANAIWPDNHLKLTLRDDVNQTLEVLATAAQSTQSVPTTGALTFGYAGATIGTNQYVSAVLVGSGGDVAYYAKLADSSSTPSDVLSVPLTGIVDDIYILKVFSEQANGDNLTDFASTPITLTLTVTGGTATVSDFVAGGGIIDEAPLLSAPSAARTSDSAATVRFFSDEAGTYHYQLDGTPPTAASLVAAGTSGTLTAGENAVSLTTLTPGAHTLYVVANDGSNVSNLLTITIPVPAAPGAPTGAVASAGDARATVSFIPPANVGSSPLTGYTVTATPVGGGASVAAMGTASPITVTGLTNGTSYTFTVVATNAVGDSPASAASGPVTPKHATPFTVTKHFGTHSGTGTVSATIDHDHTVFSHLVYNATGVTLDTSHYTVTAGSTIITFTEAYAKSLPVGTHYFTAVYSDGSSEPITLEVSATGDSDGSGSGASGADGAALPGTGDSSLTPALLTIFLALVGVGLLGLTARRRSSAGAHKK